mmetsp:Transcript_45164/g.107467  ORF Transcript_45164/g.107467 Transcript_45164/m.107467 type:complete len:223 (-) Transcript_45164:206-874(-)
MAWNAASWDRTVSTMKSTVHTVCNRRLSTARSAMVAAIRRATPLPAGTPIVALTFCSVVSKASANAMTAASRTSCSASPVAVKKKSLAMKAGPSLGVVAVLVELIVLSVEAVLYVVVLLLCVLWVLNGVGPELVLLVLETVDGVENVETVVVELEPVDFVRGAVGAVNGVDPVDTEELVVVNEDNVESELELVKVDSLVTVLVVGPVLGYVLVEDTVDGSVS